MEQKKGQQESTSSERGISGSGGSLQLQEGPAIAFRNLKDAKVTQ